MISIIVLILVSLVLSLANGTEHFDIFVLGGVLCFCVSYLFDINRNNKYNKYSAPLACGLIARVVFLMYDAFTNNPLHLPEIGGPQVTDALGFFRSAVAFSNGMSINYGGNFSRLTGSIFWFTGASRLWGDFIVMLFSLATIHTFILIIKDLDISYKTKLYGAYLACLMPNYILLSVIFRRETIISLFLALSLKSFIQWVDGKNENKSFVEAMIFALLASLFHGATGVIIVGYLGIRLIYAPNKKEFVLLKRNLAAVMLLGIVFIVLFTQFGSVFFNKVSGVSSISSISSTRNAGGASYAKYVGDSRTLGRMIIYTIPRYLYFMFSPFPWQWRGLGDILSFVMSSVPYFYILYKAISTVMHDKGNGEQKRRNLLIILLLLSFFMAFVFSWGVTNSGQAMRHRDKFIVLYAVLYVLSNNSKIKRTV